MKGKEQPWKPCADCRWFHTEGKARGMRGQREEVEKVGREEGWGGGGGREKKRWWRRFLFVDTTHSVALEAGFLSVEPSL